MFNLLKCGDVVYSPLGIPPTVWVIILIFGIALLFTAAVLLWSKIVNKIRNKYDNAKERQEDKNVTE